MKKILLISIIVMTASFTASAFVDKDIKAEIKHVTVYPDRAQLSHEAQVDIPAGITSLRLKSLSPYIDAQSIQVKGFGDFIILSVNQQNNYIQNLEELPEVKAIRSQIEALQQKVEDENAALTVLKEKEAFLVANRAILVKETSFSIDQLKNVMDLYTNSMDQVTTTTLKKNRLIKDYEKQIQALQQQISDKIGKQNLPSGEITVIVSSEKPASGKLTFSYVVTNAGWYPSYDIRVDNITKPVTIFYKANIFQNSGVTWKDVKLSFSNATPWVSGNIPELNPWFIDYFVPAPPAPVIRGVASYSRDKKSKEAAPEMVMEESLGLNESAPVAVERQTGETTVSFDVSVPYTIPSDGRIQTIEIQRSTTPAEYKYLTVPKLSPLAYLTGNIPDWAKQGLISGEATLYFENTFVGKSSLNVNQLKDTLTLSLGSDNSILVKREKQKEYTSTKILGSNKTETFSYVITVRNNKPNPIRIEVDDQMPISSNSGIEVNAIELSGGMHNALTGLVKWDLEIKSQETRQLTLTYSVKYPKDKTVVLD